MRKGKSWRDAWAARLDAMASVDPSARISRAPMIWWDEAGNITPEQFDAALKIKPAKR